MELQHEELERQLGVYSHPFEYRTDVLKEYNTAMPAYRMMAIEDPTIATCLNWVGLMLSRLEFNIYAEDPTVLEFIESWYYNLQIDAHMPLVGVDSMTYGIAPMEVVWGVDDNGMVIPSKLSPIHPTTIQEFTLNKESEIYQIVQRGHGTSGDVKIPWNYVVPFTYPENPSYPLGRSRLRPLYLLYKVLADLTTAQPKAAQKTLIGVTDVLVKGAPTEEELKARGQQFENDFRDKWNQLHVHNEDVELTFKQNTTNAYILVPMLESMKKEIARLFNAQQMFAGQGTVFDDKSTDAKAFKLSVDGLARGLAAKIEKQLVRKCLAFNGIPVEDVYVKVEWPVEEETMSEKMAYIQSMTTAGFLTPRPGDEDRIREMLNLPKVEDVVDTVSTPPPMERITLAKKNRLKPLEGMDYKKLGVALTRHEDKLRSQMNAYFDDIKEVIWTRKLRALCKSAAKKDVNGRVAEINTLKKWYPPISSLSILIKDSVLDIYNDAFEKERERLTLPKEVAPPRMGTASLMLKVEQDLVDLQSEMNKEVTMTLGNLMSEPQFDWQAAQMLINSSIESLRPRWTRNVVQYSMWADSQAKMDISKNTDIVGIIFDSYLDDTTTQGCLWAHGKYLPKTSPWFGKLVPGRLHYNCRSLAIPVTARDHIAKGLKDDFINIPKFVRDSWNLVKWG